MSEKSILIGDSENFKRVLKSFKNITNYIECIVGDYNGDKSFLGVPVYSSIDEAFDKFDYNYVIAISNDKDPLEQTSTSICLLSPSLIIEPLPNLELGF